MYRKAMLLGLLGYAAGCLIGLVIGLCAGEMSFREALPNIPGNRHPFCDYDGRAALRRIRAALVRTRQIHAVDHDGRFPGVLYRHLADFLPVVPEDHPADERRPGKTEIRPEAGITA